MNTDLRGRLRNTNLPYSKGLLPLYEAVVNSIHAIEECHNDIDQHKITITIKRLPALPLEEGKKGRPMMGDIDGFTVEDTGVGFTDENFHAFQTLDTQHKENKGGKGIGRLMWLKAFEEARVDSYYKNEQGKIIHRNFSFTIPDGIIEGDISYSNSLGEHERGTIVSLIGYNEKYRQKTHKHIDAIAKDILEHCMWYFIRPGGAPTIILQEDDQEADKLVLQEIYDDCSDVHPIYKTWKIDGEEFEINILKIRKEIKGISRVSFCANNRVVKDENFLPHLGNIANKLRDIDGQFACHCYVSSPYLDSHVRSDRLDFDFDSDMEGLFVDSGLGWKKIVESTQELLEKEFELELNDIRQAGRAKARSFVESKAPRYRYILNSLPDSFPFSPDASEREIEGVLHKELYNKEADLLEEAHKLIEAPETVEPEEYQEKVIRFIQQLDEVKNADLAAYVHKRYFVLSTIKKALTLDKEGKYKKEEILHKLIFPMQCTSDEVDLMRANLWVIDERLAFHNYLASDKPISSMPITKSDCNKEPDLCLLKINNVELTENFGDNPTLVAEPQMRYQPATLTIIEFKRPMRKDASINKNPLSQVYDYFRKIEEGKVCTFEGRPISSKGLRRYAYIICDFTEQMRRCFEDFGCKEAPDGMGYYTYNPTLNINVEIISYDQLVNAAFERNRAFFDALGISSMHLS